MLFLAVAMKYYFKTHNQGHVTGVYIIKKHTCDSVILQTLLVTFLMFFDCMVRIVKHLLENCYRFEELGHEG